MRTFFKKIFGTPSEGSSSKNDREGLVKKFQEKPKNFFSLNLLNDYSQPRSITSMAYDPIQKILIVGGSDGKIHIYGGDNSELVLYADPPNLSIKKIFTPPNEGIIIGHCVMMDKKKHEYLCSWELSSQKIIHTLKFEKPILYIKRAGKMVFFILKGDEQHVHLYNYKKKKISKVFFVLPKAVKMASLDDKTIAVLHEKNQIGFYIFEENSHKKKSEVPKKKEDKEGEKKGKKRKAVLSREGWKLKESVFVFCDSSDRVVHIEFKNNVCFVLHESNIITVWLHRRKNIPKTPLLTIDTFKNQPVVITSMYFWDEGSRLFVGLSQKKSKEGGPKQSSREDQKKKKKEPKFNSFQVFEISQKTKGFKIIHSSCENLGISKILPLVDIFKGNVFYTALVLRGNASVCLLNMERKKVTPIGNFFETKEDLIEMRVLEGIKSIDKFLVQARNEGVYPLKGGRINPSGVKVGSSDLIYTRYSDNKILLWGMNMSIGKIQFYCALTSPSKVKDLTGVAFWSSKVIIMSYNINELSFAHLDSLKMFKLQFNLPKEFKYDKLIRMYPLQIENKLIFVFKNGVIFTLNLQNNKVIDIFDISKKSSLEIQKKKETVIRFTSCLILNKITLVIVTSLGSIIICDIKGNVIYRAKSGFKESEISDGGCILLTSTSRDGFPSIHNCEENIPPFILRRLKRDLVIKYPFTCYINNSKGNVPIRNLHLNKNSYTIIISLGDGFKVYSGQFTFTLYQNKTQNVKNEETLLKVYFDSLKMQIGFISKEDKKFHMFECDKISYENSILGCTKLTIVYNKNENFEIYNGEVLLYVLMLKKYHPMEELLFKNMDVNVNEVPSHLKKQFFNKDEYLLFFMEKFEIYLTNNLKKLKDFSKIHCDFLLEYLKPTKFIVLATKKSCAVMGVNYVEEKKEKTLKIVRVSSKVFKDEIKSAAICRKNFLPFLATATTKGKIEIYTVPWFKIANSNNVMKEFRVNRPPDVICATKKGDRILCGSKGSLFEVAVLGKKEDFTISKPMFFNSHLKEPKSRRSLFKSFTDSIRITTNNKKFFEGEDFNDFVEDSACKNVCTYINARTKAELLNEVAKVEKITLTDEEKEELMKDELYSNTVRLVSYNDVKEKKSIKHNVGQLNDTMNILNQCKKKLMQRTEDLKRVEKKTKLLLNTAIEFANRKY